MVVFISFFFAQDTGVPLGGSSWVAMPGTSRWDDPPGLVCAQGALQDLGALKIDRTESIQKLGKHVTFQLETKYYGYCW